MGFWVTENPTPAASMLAVVPGRHVTATSWVKAMRGGTQAQLIRGDDGSGYVVKSPQNPQGRRVLVNEWIVAGILRYMGLLTAKLQPIRITNAVLDASVAMVIRTGSTVTRWSPCLALGSRYPGEIGSTAVYDYIPSPLIATVANFSEFLGMLVVDKWTANQDSRQAIFLRDRVGLWLHAAGVPPQTKRFIAQFVDHGQAFGGSGWNLDSAPLMGAFRDSSVYGGVTGWEDFEPYLDGVEQFPPDQLRSIMTSVPEEWLDPGDSERLDRLCDQLLTRRPRVRSLIEEMKTAAPSMFPLWT